MQEPWMQDTGWSMEHHQQHSLNSHDVIERPVGLVGTRNWNGRMGVHFWVPIAKDMKLYNTV